MEGRPSRGRGGQWRRGGIAGGNDSGGVGERRGRGRGGHHRGRGKRDHYRGRGRGLPEDGAADVFRRGQDEHDDKENAEDEMPAIYSRRKLESNWDRYKESEKEEVNDDVPVQRGTDYHVLLTSAGDSFTQFRFSEEKDWEMDSLGTNQVPALFVDLEVLARSLQELPLHHKLDLEPSLVQESTPVELPSLGVLNKVNPIVGGFKLPAPAKSGQEPGSHGSRPVKPVPGTSVFSHTSNAVSSPGDDADEELDLLLGLQKPVAGLSLAESETSNTVEDVSAVSEEAASLVEEPEEEVVDVERQQTEAETNRHQQKPEESRRKSEPVKQELTEEDLEDWLDSLIS
ncbi:cell death regulator Aven [Ictalurus furcatus]|uniref:cell death regulator Aven n=1 Tax=Ictalurus furcatus TaxID=66913 RepID=UPI0023507FEE|nr:cell death regulator Aven [Ictalurus furcatus]